MPPAQCMPGVRCSVGTQRLRKLFLIQKQVWLAGAGRWVAHVSPSPRSSVQVWGRWRWGGAVVAALTCFMRHPILVFKSGALKAAQPFSPPHFVWPQFKDAVSSEAHGRQRLLRGSSLASPSRTGLPSPISHSHNPPSPSSNCSPRLHFVAGEALKKDDATAHHPPRRSLGPGCFPINIYSSFSQAPYLIACLLYHLHSAAWASLRFFAELNVHRWPPRLLFELFLKFAECYSFRVIVICHVWTHWIERIKLQMAST